MLAKGTLIGSDCLLQVGVTGAPRGKSKQTIIITFKDAGTAYRT